MDRWNLLLAAAMTIASPSAIARGRPGAIAIELQVVRATCGTCGMPPGAPVGVQGATVLLRRSEQGPVIQRRTTRANGLATFTLAPGRYCFTAVTQAETPPSCMEVGRAGTVPPVINVERCPVLHCSGREP